MDGSGEFDSECQRGLRGQGVFAFTLEEVHAVEAKGFDFDERLGGCRCGYGGLVVHVEVFDWAFAVFDVDCTHGGHVVVVLLLVPGGGLVRTGYRLAVLWIIYHFAITEKLHASCGGVVMMSLLTSELSQIPLHVHAVIFE